MKKSKNSFQNNLSLIPEVAIKLEDSNKLNLLASSSNRQAYEQIKKIVERRKQILKKSTKVRSASQQLVVRSDEELKLMSKLKPKFLPVLSPGKKGKKNKSSFDKILTNKDKFMKTYFYQIKYFKNHEKHDEIGYEFPQTIVGQWKVNGFLRGDSVLLQGKNRAGKIHYKKYNYQVVHQKIRNNYEQWVNDKFCYE